MSRTPVHPVSSLQYPPPRSHCSAGPVASWAPRSPQLLHTPFAAPPGLPPLCPGTCQQRAPRQKTARVSLTSPRAPHFPPAFPPSPGRHPYLSPPLGLGGSRTGWRHRAGKSDSRQLCTALTTRDTCQRHRFFFSAFICHTHCLWVSSQLLISLLTGPPIQLWGP